MFVLLFCGVCSRDRNVDLTLDFSGAQAWRFAVDARVTGTIGSTGAENARRIRRFEVPDEGGVLEGGRRAFESAAQCTLLGTADAKNSAILHVSVPYAHFSSNILTGAELENLMSQSREVRLACNLRDGAIVPDDTAAMPMVRIGEWDIFKDLAKVIPALPKIRVKPGASWDREKAVPLDTRHGDAVGHLIQSFRLDSVFIGPGGKTTACVSWNFFYRLELRGRDTGAAGLLDRMPSKGSGTGRALIDIDGKSLESASMSFSVPAPSEGTYRISWNETISLRRVY